MGRGAGRRWNGFLVLAVVALSVAAVPATSVPASGAASWSGFSLSAAPSSVGNGSSPAWAAGVTTDLGGPGLDIWSNNHIFDSEALIDIASGNPQFGTASGYGATALIDTHGISFSDIDGDGDEDLIETMGRTNSNRVFENVNGVLGEIPAGILADFDGRGRQSLPLDYDGDGDMDILVTNLDLRVPPVNSPTNSPSQVYLNNGSGTVWTVASNPSGALSGGSLRLAQQTSTGPGSEQIVITHNSFAIATDAIATGSSSIQAAANPATSRSSSHVRDVVLGDFDGDLHPELVVARGNASASPGAWPLEIYDLVEGGSPVAVPDLPIDPLVDNCRSVAAGDFDNDGDLDIFAGCSQLQEGQDRNVLLVNDGSGNFSIGSTELLPASLAVTAAGLAIGDLDSDGWLDVWIGNGYDAEMAPDHLAMNEGGVGANYVSVNLYGSNPDAAGAQVFVGSADWQVRETGHRTRRGHDARALHFGLGGATEIAPIEVMWPDGSFESCTVSGINQAVDIHQGSPECVSRSEAGFLAAIEAAPVIAPTVPSCNGLPITVDISAGQTPTAGDDVILGTATADLINGLAGDDTICGLGGTDTLVGGPGNDTILGGAGDDLLSGAAGEDVLSGGAGVDRINGGAGSDVIHGGDGDDDLRGQGGDDVLNGNGGVDQFFAGSGADTINTGLDGNAGTGMIVQGQSGADTIFGSAQDDVLDGGLGQDEIHGGAGNDVLNGGRSGDQLFGDAGDDQLLGGPDRDTLDGGAGSDVCNGGGATNDTATDACELTALVP